MTYLDKDVDRVLADGLARLVESAVRHTASLARARDLTPTDLRALGLRPERAAFSTAERRPREIRTRLLCQRGFQASRCATPPIARSSSSIRAADPRNCAKLTGYHITCSGMFTVGMILTGAEIQREWSNGRITIEPFTPEQINPNSYNFRLGRTLRVYRDFPLDPRRENDFQEIDVPEEGYLLAPRRLYLAHTLEVLGSDHYAPTFAARSSVARLGMFINLSASLGDIGFKGQWTLQLYTLNSIRVYPGMNVGQMMWWVPHGGIQLYNGKYQGSEGPRQSDIHVDFDKPIARRRFPALGASVEADVVGPKFEALSASSLDFRVPRAFSIPAPVLDAALGDDLRLALADAFADLRATVGAFFGESVERIARLGEAIRFPDTDRQLIALRLKEVFGDEPEHGFAVRSSGLGEDTENASLAGVHQSLLGVRGIDGVIAAIERCWASHYAAPAVAARVRAGDLSSVPRFAVIVQEMLAPRIAGVAFTRPDAGGDDVVIEHTTGTADELVAGIVEPVRVTSCHVMPGEPDAAALTGVVALARDLRDAHGHEVDVEWAADENDDIHLLQVRPLTAELDGRRAVTGPLAESFSLYFDVPPPGVELGAVAGVYGYYVAKRAPAYRLARELGVATGAGWVLQFNGRGLAEAESVERLRVAMATGASHECVVDLGDALRQIVLPKDDVLRWLADVAGGPHSLEPHAAIVRDFVRGELGLVSRLVGDGVVVEHSSEGLMALNRGTSGGATLHVSDRRRPEAPAGGADDPHAAAILSHVAGIAALGEAMNAVHGDVALEWVVADDRLHFVDYSPLQEELPMSSSGAVLISAGTAAGPLLRLDDDELLRRLSIGPAVSIDHVGDVAEHDGFARIVERVRSSERPPIVVAHRPYAVLSVLIGHVAGFVFEAGSTLGHLAILLREAGVPAVARAGAPSTGEAVIANGTLTVLDLDDRAA